LVFAGAIDKERLAKAGYTTRRHQSGKSFSTQKTSQAGFSIETWAYMFAQQLSVENLDEFALEIGSQNLCDKKEESFLCPLCQKLFSTLAALD